MQLQRIQLNIVQVVPQIFQKKVKNIEFFIEKWLQNMKTKQKNNFAVSLNTYFKLYPQFYYNKEYV